MRLKTKITRVPSTSAISVSNHNRPVRGPKANHAAAAATVIR